MYCIVIYVLLYYLFITLINNSNIFNILIFLSSYVVYINYFINIFIYYNDCINLPSLVSYKIL